MVLSLKYPSAILPEIRKIVLAGSFNFSIIFHVKERNNIDKLLALENGTFRRILIEVMIVSNMIYVHIQFKFY